MKHRLQQRLSGSVCSSFAVKFERVVVAALVPAFAAALAAAFSEVCAAAFAVAMFAASLAAAFAAPF